MKQDCSNLLIYQGSVWMEGEGEGEAEGAVIWAGCDRNNWQTYYDFRDRKNQKEILYDEDMTKSVWSLINLGVGWRVHRQENWNCST